MVERNNKMPPDDKKRMLKCIKETIHSGHFMVSEIDDNEVTEEIHSPSVVHESDCDQEASNDFQFEDIPKETKKEIYTFGPRSSHSISIEVSLTQLFQCMSLAYSGKLTSPRWKTFKGLKLRLKDKIRLNNIIWRAWHIQFISKRKPPVCQFASPLDSDGHNKSEVMVVEENLWKSKVSSIAAEYKKRRMYFKDRFRSKQRKSSPENNTMSMDWDSKWSTWSNSNLSSVSPGLGEDLVDFSDTLFSSLFSSQPLDFPYHREIAKVGISADFIQPGLAQLQPSIDDFMDTFESLQEFLSPKLPTLLEEGSEQNVLDSISSMNQQVIKVPTFGNVPQSKQFDIASMSNNVTPCESSYSIDEQPFRVHQQNTSPSMIGNVNNICSQSVVQEMNPSSLDVTTRQSTIQNSVNSALNSSIVSSDNITSMPRTLRTNQRNEPSLTSFKTLNVPLNSEKRRTDQPTPDFNCAMNIASQSNKQSSFLATGRLQSHLPSQVPLALSSQTRTAQQERFINRSSKHPPQISPSPIQHSNSNSNINLTYQTPVHMANVVPSQLPLTTQSHISLSAVNSSTMTAVKSESTLHKMNSTGGIVTSSKLDASELSNELAQIRRHSYTGLSVDEILLRKNMLHNRTNLSSITNTPKMASGEKFVIPETPVKQRVRSRSVSSPQAGTLSTNSLQPSTSISMNNISTSPPLITQQSQTGESLSFASKNSFMSNTTSNRNISGILPQNAVLAQLLMSGTTIAPRLERPLSFTSVTTATTTTTTLSSTVTIINSIPTLAATTPTFVLSPVAIATVASVPALQRNLLVDTATNQIVGCQTSSQDGISANISPSLLNSSIDGNGSPSKPFRPKSDEERVQYKEHRRVCHINAEQKRRCNIKNGFESLRHLLPSLSQNPNAKVSKAAMLQKAAEYIRALKIERQQQQEEAELLRQKRDSLNESISLYQKQLPATGAPIPCQKTNRIRELFDDYVRTQTLQNWKFWIFSLLMEPLLEAYNDTVSTGSITELCDTVLDWVNQHCSLITLRPGVLNSLRNLGTTTNILTDPTRLPEEATRAVAKKETNLH